MQFLSIWPFGPILGCPGFRPSVEPAEHGGPRVGDPRCFQAQCHHAHHRHGVLAQGQLFQKVVRLNPWRVGTGPSRASEVCIIFLCIARPRSLYLTPSVCLKSASSPVTATFYPIPPKNKCYPILSTDWVGKWFRSSTPPSVSQGQRFQKWWMSLVFFLQCHPIQCHNLPIQSAIFGGFLQHGRL